MKRFLIISILIGAAVYTADAQLLEDNDSRLKTKKVERKGFLFFRNKKKVGKSSGIPGADGRRSPRYSSASSPFKLSKTSSPRYSPIKQKQKRYSVVCTFWMKGNCKKGDKCEYLHSNDPAKYSICHDHLLGV